MTERLSEAACVGGWMNEVGDRRTVCLEVGGCARNSPDPTLCK